MRETFSAETTIRSITRRDLLAGASALGIGAALSGCLTGCSPQAPAKGSAAAESADELPSTGSGAARDELNPQESLVVNKDADTSQLFQPLAIGDFTARNRLVKSAAGSYALMDSFDDPVATGFYREIAKGGTGTVLVEDCFWVATDPANVRPVVEAIHEEGALAGVQIWGMWDHSSSEKPSASRLECVGTGFPRAQMTTEQVHEFQDYVLGLVSVYDEAGFDVIELNASCDHTFASFLSRFLNVSRDDEYGPQSFENRARILTEIIERIKAEHPRVAVQVLFNGVEEHVEELGDSALCMQPEEAVEIAKLLEQAGADALQVRSTVFGNHAAGFLPDIMHVGSHGNTGLGGQVDFSQHFSGIVDGANEGVGALLNVAAFVKQSVAIPVGVVGDMDPRLAPELCNNAIAEGKVDFLVLNRPLLADPELPNKLKAGNLGAVRPCNKCISCFQSVVNGEGIGFCRVNPAHIRAFSPDMPEGYLPVPAEAPKKVLVIGGGPAGMEAALVAAQRGHSVTLVEEDSSLGGMATFAAAIKGPHERIADYLEYQQQQMEAAGIEIVTGVRADAAYVREAAPDAVIIATGGATPAASLTESGPALVPFSEVASFQPEGKVCIVGGSLRATDYANYLVNQGVKVELVHSSSEADLAAAQAPWVRAVILSWLKATGAVLHHEASSIAATAEGVSYATPYGTQRTIACDAIVLADDLTEDSALEQELGAEFTVVRVGDAAAPASILEAVSSAHLAARAL